MTHLLDTDTCIAHLRQGAGSPVAARLGALAPADAVLCSVVVAELLYGVFHGGNPQKYLPALRAFLAGFDSLPFDDAAAERHAGVRQHLSSGGQAIGPHDPLIASIALSHNLTLVTRNLREFSRVLGLRVEDWTTP